MGITEHSQRVDSENMILEIYCRFSILDSYTVLSYEFAVSCQAMSIYSFP
jgi:hypothetical protein